MSSTKLSRTLAAMAVTAMIAAPAAAAQTTDVPPPPSSIAASAAAEYEQLRAPTSGEPSGGGFDWTSAAIGGIAAAGLSLVSMAALGMRSRRVAGAGGERM